MEKTVVQTSALTKHLKHRESPFMEDLLKMKTRDKTVSWANKAIPLANTETGEIEQIGMIVVRQKVDKEKFVKIYTAELKALFDLSKRAMKLLSYFMQALRINQDKVYFNSRECMEFTGYKSNASIQFALTELLEKKFIAKSDAHNVFFTNPMAFFNGDRMVIVREYLHKSPNEMKDQKQYDLLTGQTNADMTKLLEAQKESGNNMNSLSEINPNINPNN